MTAVAVRVLVAEDDATQALVLEKCLAEAGLTVLLARSIAGALALAETQHPDVAVLDLHLPDSEGMETVRRFHAGAPNLPFVVLTALMDPDMAREAVRGGAMGYITKGTETSEDMPARLTRMLRRFRASTSLQQMVQTLDRRAVTDATEKPESD